jgi:predicted metal-dependent phosphoesterase TrpH
VRTSSEDLSRQLSRDLSRRRFLQVAAGAGAFTVVPGLRIAASALGDNTGTPLNGEWLAGDFHVHTTWSHDVWGGPDDDNTDTPAETYTFGWTPAEQIRNAELRGLNFVALTDHNRVRILDDPGWKSDSLVLVPGYEHSLAYGHAGVFVPDPEDLRGVFFGALARSDDHTFNFGEDGGLSRFVDAIHAAGGVAVINHPADHSTWKAPTAISTGFDAVEAWNSSWLQRDNVTPQVYSNDYLAAQFWEREFLKNGHRKGVTGGSDNHWRSTTAVQGVGQPTTWVYARNRSAHAVVEGVRAGRTFVSAQPPAFGGARAYLSAAEDFAGAQDRPVIPGGSVRALAPASVTVRVENAPGHRVRLIASGGVVRDDAVTSPIETHVFRNVVLAEGGWLRAEVYADPGFAMAALTSPIYAGPPAPTPQQRPVTTTTPLSYASPLDVLPRHTEELP